MKRLLALILTLPTTTQLVAQQLCLAEGSPTSLRIATVPEANPNAPDTRVLTNVEFLPIEMTGRTLAHEFDASRPRRLQRDGLWRIELPDGGRILRYRRDGGQHWGFLHVARDGATRVVVERPGLGNTDPFLDRVAVAEDARHGAVGLVTGGLVTFRLDGQNYASTGRADRLAAPPSHFVEEASAMVGPTHVFYVTGNDRIHRCALADAAVPVDVTPPLQVGARLKDQLAMSRDGTVVVFLYGPQRVQRLYRVGVAGASMVLPPPASKYEEPDYLPEEPGEPAMLLSDDGSRLFYIDSAVRDELWMLDIQGALPPLQVTGDAVFEPYIGVHILPKFQGTNLMIAIGDPGRMDWFRAQLAPAGGTVDNLTGTGSTMTPYPAGTLDPTAAAVSGNEAFVIERVGISAQLRRLDLVSGGSSIVGWGPTLTVARASSVAGAADLLVRTASGDALRHGATGAVLGSTPAGIALTPPVQGVVAATWVHLSSGVGMVGFYFRDGTSVPGLVTVGPPRIVMTAADGIVLQQGNQVRYFAVGTDVVLQRPNAAVRRLLSGAGA
ncbi:MAG: hypothetical protein NXI31_09860 [bacterium]|nr:hypothetical protein [bacterium]